MSLLSWFSQSAVSESEVRAEIWRLGSRHMGEPLQGALAEIDGEDVSADRVRLLRECVRALRARA